MNTNDRLQKIKDAYVTCNTETVEYNIDGIPYRITRHYKDKILLSKTFYQIALHRAEKEAGIK